MSRYADADGSNQSTLQDAADEVGLVLDEAPWSCMQYLAKLGSKQKHTTKGR
jgi:hypothetical protein